MNVKPEENILVNGWFETKKQKRLKEKLEDVHSDVLLYIMETAEPYHS